MQLTEFIEQLLNSGAVVVSNGVIPFAEDDLAAAQTRLQQFHQQDALERPGTAPSFDGPAATWAASYLYRAIQLVMLRNLDEEAITEHLADYSHTITAETVYSVDLCFRHLPSLLLLAKGLAPNDPLVLRLKETARQWPFSSPGMEGTAEGIDLTAIVSHSSLRCEYRDRIIQARDIKRAQPAPILSLVQEALGQHTELLWPEFTIIDPTPIEISNYGNSTEAGSPAGG